MTISAVRGFVERIESGENFLFVRGWVAGPDLSRLHEPVTLRISGFGDWVVEKLSFRPDLLKAGVGDGWGAFFETIRLAGAESMPKILAARGRGDFSEITNKHTVYERFIPKGGLEKEFFDEISGWVFDPKLGAHGAKPQLFLDGQAILEIDLDQSRPDLPFDPTTNQHFGFRVPAKAIDMLAAVSGPARRNLSLVTSGVKVANLEIEVDAGNSKEISTGLEIKIEYFSAFKTGIFIEGWVRNLDHSYIDSPIIFILGGIVVEVDHLNFRNDMPPSGAAGRAGFSIFFDGIKSDERTLNLTCVCDKGTVVTSMSSVPKKDGVVNRTVTLVGEEVLLDLFDPDELPGKIAIWIEDVEIGPLVLEPPINYGKIWRKNGPMQTAARVNIEWLVRRYREIVGDKLNDPARERKIKVVADGFRALAETIVVISNTFRGRLDRYDENGLRGWLATGDGQRLAEYEVLINGIPFRKGIANMHRGDLEEKGIVKKGGGFLVSLVNPSTAPVIEVNVRPVGRSLPIAGGPLTISDAPVSRSRTENAYAVYTMATRVGVSVIIPIHNAANDLIKCLAALRSQTPNTVRVILIDDCSSDPAIQEILSGYANQPNWHVSKNDVNLGFTKTVNLGIGQAVDDDVIFLNSDTIVTPGWVQGLRIAAYSAPRVATATPLSNAAGVFSVPEMNEENQLPAGYTLNDVARIVRLRSMATFPRVPTGNGFCMYVRRDCLRDIGLLDDEAFPVGYGEENDFCMRALHRGYEHVMDDRTFIYHKRSASFGTKKDELYESGRQVLSDRYPEYRTLTEVFAESPNILAARWRVRSAFALPKILVRPRVLFVIATTTGGTPQTNADLMAALQDHYEGWILQCDGETMRLYERKVSEDNLAWRLRLEKPIDPSTHRSEDYNSAIFEIFVKFGFELVHIRHLAWHGLDLPRLCKAMQIPVVFSFHDFYTACPTIKLLDESGIFCGGKCTSSNGDCSVELWNQSKFPKLKHSFIRRWREMFRDALMHCDVFVTTSEFAKDTLVRNFDFLRNSKFQVIPHGRDFKSFQSAAIERLQGDPLKILVPGNISNAKGAALVAELSRRDEGKNIEFHIIGDHGRLIPGPGLVIHGAYQRNEFAKAAEKVGASIGAVLSRWPETYCHTLTELWSIGLPVVGFDIGAIGERIRAHDGGWLLDLDQSVDEIYDFFLKLPPDVAGRSSKVSEVIRWQENYGAIYGTEQMAAQYDLIYRALLGLENTKEDLSSVLPNQ